MHLLEENEAYKEAFTKACKEREVILDNSIFELGEAFDMKKFFEWSNKLEPTWYIIPDALEDSKRTIFNAYIWNQFHRPTAKGKSIAVVQGKTYEEIVGVFVGVTVLVGVLEFVGVIDIVGVLVGVNVVVTVGVILIVGVVVIDGVGRRGWSP